MKSKTFAKCKRDIQESNFKAGKLYEVIDKNTYDLLVVDNKSGKNHWMGRRFFSIPLTLHIIK